MKFLIVAPTPFFTSRGTHIRILEEAIALEHRGNEITIATYHIGGDIPPQFQSKIDVRRIRRWLFWYKKLEAGADWQKLILDVMLLRKVFFLARTQKPDVIYAHLHEGALIGWIVKKVLFHRKIKLVVDMHGSLTGEMHSHGYLEFRFLRLLFSWIERRINMLGDITVASSWEYAEHIAQDRLSSHPEVLVDGVNVRSYQKLPSAKELKVQFNLPQNKTIFVYAGAFLPNKGIKTLLWAIRDIIRRDSSLAHFVLAGSPPGYVEAFIRDNKLERNITYICPLDYADMPRVLSACDIGIDPKDSSTAQASGKILQYMAAGLPVLCFDRVNNRRYLEEGGYYVQDATADGLAQGIWEIMKYPDAITEKRRSNFQRASEFSWDSGARKIEELIAIFDGVFAPTSVSGYTKKERYW